MLNSKSDSKPSQIKYIIGVAAGKGGVGKSSLSVNLACALQFLNFKVGLMDTDIYGPSVRKMLPESKMPEQIGERIIPADCNGIKMISMAYFRKEDEAAVVRAPIANGIIQQFIKNVDWGDLDYLIIDFPPGTGDIQLTLSQNASLSGVVMITTPQEVALLDVRKAMKMFYQVKVPIIGVVENMSYFQVPNSHDKHYPFGKGGGERLASQEGFSLLGEIPIHPDIAKAADEGINLFKCSSKVLSDVANLHLDLAKNIVAHLKVLKNKAIEVDKILQKDKHTFTVIWSDHKACDFRLDELQKQCPCAGCRDEVTGKSLVDVSLIPQDLRAHNIEPVGKYALRIQFMSGCSKGIYSFDYLRKLADKKV